MAQSPPHPAEAEQLRADIQMLRSVLNSAIDRHADRETLDVVADLIRERQDRLEELEHARLPWNRLQGSPSSRRP